MLERFAEGFSDRLRLMFNTRMMEWSMDRPTDNRHNLGKHTALEHRQIGSRDNKNMTVCRSVTITCMTPLLFYVRTPRVACSEPVVDCFILGLDGKWQEFCGREHFAATATVGAHAANWDLTRKRRWQIDSSCVWTWSAIQSAPRMMTPVV